jgi:hypothetical protein
MTTDQPHATVETAGHPSRATPHGNQPGKEVNAVDAYQAYRVEQLSHDRSREFRELQLERLARMARQEDRRAMRRAFGQLLVRAGQRLAGDFEPHVHAARVP